VWEKEQQPRGHGWWEGAFPSHRCIGQLIKLNQIASNTAFGEKPLFESGDVLK